MKKYVLALDEGTTSCRAILFDETLNAVAVSGSELACYYPKPGWVEQNPVDIYANQYACMMECLAKSGVSISDVKAIGITNQRETTIVWDKATGSPIYNAIVWQCRRTADICKELLPYKDYIKTTTGLELDAYFSATKIKWILDNVDGAREKAERGELLFGTVDTWLVYKLTGGKVHVTDYSNASRTMLFNINSGVWDDKLLSILNIPKSMLPKVTSSSEIYATVNVMGENVPIASIVGDQQSALFGQGCFFKGTAKSTYGTGCFLLANTGSDKIDSKNGLITTITANVKGEPIEYALEGSVFVGGAVIKWLRDELRIISDSRDSEYYATKVSDTGGVYVVPAFSGLGAPYWDMEARGTITGITRGTSRAHIIRAGVESIAYQTNDLIEAINKEQGYNLTELRVDGGASNNGFLMQFQADVSSVTVLKPENSEATALGTAMLAGLATGVFESKAQLLTLIKTGATYVSNIDENKRNELLKGWQRAVRACRVK
ncbi:MAG: glycerol kinase GlpK [Clostridia bacterium]|nr:glycerol kinase GlpK [Clostridia bacterium]